VLAGKLRTKGINDMERYIVHMYELSKFMQSLNKIAGQSPVSAKPIHLTSRGNQLLAEKRRESVSIDDPDLMAAAERLGVSLPPLFGSK
jgi:hypothetical protein